VAKGELHGEDINQTVDRIEGATNLAMDLVAVYTKEGGQVLLFVVATSVAHYAGRTTEVVTTNISACLEM
jgi:hypothetical protein